MHVEDKKNPSNFLSRERSEVNNAIADDMANMEICDSLDAYLVKAIQEYKDLYQSKSPQSVHWSSRTQTLISEATYNLALF